MVKNKITIRDVAKKAKVSVASVSYVINGVDKVSDETKQKVLEVIEELNYRPDITARNLAKQEKTFIGILMPIKENYKKTILTDNPFYQEFLSGAEYAARKNNLSTIIIGINDAANYSKHMDTGSFLGIIVLGAIEEEFCDRLESLDIPVVLVDQDKRCNDFISLCSDDKKGAYDAVKYLISKGHRQIALLGGEIETSSVHINRFKGYEKALKEENIKIDQDIIFQMDVTYEGGIIAAEKVKDNLNKISAVFCMSDIVAIGLIKGLIKRNIFVPKDVSVIGFDDIRHCKYLNPELTTVKQDIFAKGEKAVDILVDEYNKPSEVKEYVLPVELVERESVR